MEKGKCLQEVIVKQLGNNKYLSKLKYKII